MDDVLLEAVDISKSYRKTKAVEHLSFQVQKGQVFGLLGSNGAGKSTTLSMIATLMKPDSGKILFYGQDVWKKPAAFREKIGYVPQDVALYESLSGMDNLKFWGHVCHLRGGMQKERIHAVREIIGFTDQMLRQKVQEYSGGMKRRLNIAAALLRKPELLILDEPTAGVDLHSGNLILDAIRDLAKEGMAAIYVGHSLEEVEKLCDCICIMEHGHALLSGPLSEILKAGAQTKEKAISLEQVYRELLESAQSD